MVNSGHLVPWATPAPEPDIPVAFNGVVVDFGQSIPGSHHYLVKFRVPQAADDTLEKKKRKERMRVGVWVRCQAGPWFVDHVCLAGPAA